MANIYNCPKCGGTHYGSAVCPMGATAKAEHQADRAASADSASKPMEKAPPSNTSDVTYPRYFQTIVGVAPDKMKYFSTDDMKTLVEVFKLATGFDPLTTTTKPLAEIWSESIMDACR